MYINKFLNVYFYKYIVYICRSINFICRSMVFFLKIYVYFFVAASLPPVSATLNLLEKVATAATVAGKKVTTAGQK